MRLLPIDEYSTPSATFRNQRTSTIISDNNSYVSLPKSSSKQSLRRRALSAAHHSYREQGNAQPISCGFSDLDPEFDSESYHRLPRISGVSSLKVPSILELPSSCISLRSSAVMDVTHSGNFSALGPTTKRQDKTFGTLNIPSLMHPNSPYVPWSSPVRKKILCPLPQESEEHDHNTPYLPAGTESSLLDGSVEFKETKSVFRRIINGTLRKAKRVTQYRTRKDSPNRKTVQHHHQDNNIAREPHALPPIYSRRFSVASVRSAETNTLSIWLAERRQLLDVELDFTPLDEHFSAHRDI